MLEGMNPYTAPRVDTNVAPSSPSRRTGWKIYAYCLVAIQIVGLFYSLPKMNLSRALDDSVTIVGMLGLFGFAYRRPLLRRQVWMLWSAVLPLWDIMMGAWVYPRETVSAVEGVQMVYFIALLIFIPEYLALIRYGYSSRELWHKTTSAG